MGLLRLPVNQMEGVRWFLDFQIPTAGWALSVRMVTRPSGGFWILEGVGKPRTEGHLPPGAPVREVALMKWVIQAWAMPASEVRGQGWVG